MNKTGLIFRNELLTTLKRKGFIITTLTLPVLGILGLLIFQLVTGFIQPRTPDEITRVGYVDEVGLFTDYTAYEGLELVGYEAEPEALAALLDGEVQEYFVIPPDYLESGRIDRYSTRTEIDIPGDVVAVTRSFLVQNLLKGQVDESLMRRVNAPLALNTTVLDESGQVSQGQGGIGAYLIAYLFSILLLMSIFTASGYLLQGLSEEKENRIMEVLLSSVSTRELISGKVLALGAAGLVQIVVWLASGYLLMGIASLSLGGFFSSLAFPPQVVILSLVYFILGYALYAILMAGVGAVAPTQRDGQQMSMIFTLFGALPYFLMPFIIENSTHIVSRILTIFPLTAPLTVMLRINSGLPLWEIGVSIAVLLLAIWGSLWLASRVFRVYLLMYGKAPGWKEIIRSLRQSA